jgi:hypothetical protein
MATRAILTNYPQGMQSDIGIRNVPAVVTNSGRNVWVDSNGQGTGSASQRRGTYQRPYTTVALAISAMQAYDTIWVKAGHTESITAAGGWTLNQKGVRIIGIGSGDNRPQISFTTAAGASCLISSAGCEVSNIIGLAGVGSLTNPFNVQAAGTVLNLEWRDVTATTAEALRAILTNASCANSYFNLKYRGLGGGAVNLNAIRLVGSTNVDINIDFYGNAITGVIEFITTQSKNVTIVGTMNNKGSTGSATVKTIVDTAGTSSTFQSIVYMGSNSGTLSTTSVLAV